MNLIKIGKYIGEKRKKLGMTQRQLAEKINMSDKSISKWERGICLPDVSVYMELCDILGISINEFLAGEDISEENIIKKSEDNLIQVAKDSKHKQKTLKIIIAVLIIFTIVSSVSLGAMIYDDLNRPQNYIVAADRDSIEMKTAEMLSGDVGTFLFKYSSKDKFKMLTIYMSEYQSGKLIKKEAVAEFDCSDMDSGPEGMIVILPDFNKFEVTVIVTDSCGKFSTTIPILESEQSKEDYGRSATKIEEITPIQWGTEQGLAVFIYDKNLLRGTTVKELENGEADDENDYTYYFSFKFEK